MNMIIPMLLLNRTNVYSGSSEDEDPFEGLGKFLLIVFGTLFSITGIVFYLSVSDPFDWRQERTYCGKVASKFEEARHYKSRNYSDPHVVFYSDSLKRNIDVKVTWNTYVNIYEGKNVCFTLTKNQLK